MVFKQDEKHIKFTYTSSNENIEAPYSVKIGRYIFKILSKVSNRLAGKFASYLFFRPRRQHFKKFDNEIIAKSFKSDVIVNGKSIKVYSWGNSDKKVLFVHGWEGKATSGKHFIEPLIQTGFQLISFDAPAHGYSSGSSTDLPEIVQTIQQINHLYGPFEFVIAHSFGSLAVLLALNDDHFSEKIVLIGSMSNPFTAIKGFKYLFSLNEQVIKGLLQHLQNRVGKSLEEYQLTNKNNFQLKKILLIHDKLDMIAPFSESLYLAQKFPQAQIIPLQDAGHHRILSNDQTIALVKHFILD